jgi:hypothetical protein
MERKSALSGVIQMKFLVRAYGPLRSLDPRQHLRELQCPYLFTTAHCRDFDSAAANRLSSFFDLRFPIGGTGLRDQHDFSVRAAGHDGGVRAAGFGERNFLAYHWSKCFVFQSRNERRMNADEFVGRRVP